MKRIFTVAIFLFSLLLNISCHKHPCEGLSCQNGGTLSESTEECYCSCPDGYEGQFCERKKTDKLTGGYVIQGPCSVSSSGSYTLTGTCTISDVPGYTRRVLVNLPGQTYNGSTSSTTITTFYIDFFDESYSSFSIPQQPFHNNGQINGSGFVSFPAGGSLSISINYNINSSTDWINCNATLVRM